MGLGLVMPMLSFHLLEAPIRAWRPPHHGWPVVSMLALIGATVGWIGLLRGPLGESISLITAPSTCPRSGELGSFEAYVNDATADTTIQTAFGRAINAPPHRSACACRACAGIYDNYDVNGTVARPRHVVDEEWARDCMSTYPLHFESEAGEWPKGSHTHIAATCHCIQLTHNASAFAHSSHSPWDIMCVWSQRG